MNINLKNISDTLEELVLYITELSENDSRFLSTKLNKLVWAADFACFCETGRTISGANYQREKFGPVPKAMPIVLDRLKTEGRIEMRKVSIASMQGVRPIAKKPANPSAFSQRHLMIVGKVVAENFAKTGKQMSDESHTRLAWQVMDNSETIPFSAWFVTNFDPNPDHLKVAGSLEPRAKLFHAAA